MENSAENNTDATATANRTPANSSSAQKKYVMVDRFSETIFKIIPVLLLASFLVVVGVLILIMILSLRKYPEPGFVRDLTDGQYEMIVHDPSNAFWLRGGPAEDTFFRPGYWYLLLRTDADVLSKLESMNGKGFRFVPLDGLDEKDLEGPAYFKSEAEILKAIGAHADVPLEGECRVFLSEGDRENTYICWFPETKLVLLIESDFWKSWFSDEKEQETSRR